MTSSEEQGTARVVVDQIRINSVEIERAVVGGLTSAGFDVEIEPEFKDGDRCTVRESSVIKVYMKVVV